MYSYEVLIEIFNFTLTSSPPLIKPYANYLFNVFEMLP